MPRVYRTISLRLIEDADKVADYLEQHGYEVEVEQSELGFPYTPTFLFKRQRTTVIVDVADRIVWERVDAWVGYARSTGQDTRCAICLSQKAQIDADQEAALRTKGVGLFRASADGATECIPPSDLGLNLALPELARLPKKIRRLLGGAYEQFRRTQWREGFEDACQALENEARRHLRDGIRNGRIHIMTKSGPNNPPLSRVEKMTMGQLGDHFSRIQNQTHADSVVCQALARINKDRVGVAHHKGKRRTESSLRKNVGKHMWTIVAALRVLP
jgi:hypothetical protein